jgi:hypothetical protein
MICEKKNSQSEIHISIKIIKFSSLQEFFRNQKLFEYIVFTFNISAWFVDIRETNLLTPIVRFNR